MGKEVELWRPLWRNKVEAQVPDRGKTMKPSFHFTTRITTPYLKTWFTPKAKILNYRDENYQDHRIYLGKSVFYMLSLLDVEYLIPLVKNEQFFTKLPKIIIKYH